jgi:hypothetical protein
VGKLSPVEVYRVTNETSADKFYGSKYRVDRIYGNAGDQISCVTNAMVHGDWPQLDRRAAYARLSVQEQCVMK